MPGNNGPYRIEYAPNVEKEEIPALPKTVRAVIKKAIEERLVLDPVRFGKPLRYSLKGLRRLRVGDYRIVYRVNLLDNVVVIVMIKHRKDVYE